MQADAIDKIDGVRKKSSMLVVSYVRVDNTLIDITEITGPNKRILPLSNTIDMATAVHNPGFSPHP